MNRLPVDPEEMARRQDEDYIASLKMIGEGGPVFDSLHHEEDDVKVEDRNKNLPETYQ